MKTRAALVLAAVAGSATAANAQVQAFAGGNPVVVSYSLTVAEVNAATLLPSAATPGVIDESEAVRFELRANYSVAPGTALTFPPSILAGSSGGGTLQGFWSGGMDILGDGGASSAAGTWTVTGGAGVNARGVRFPYDAGSSQGASGSSNADGSRLLNVQPAVFTASIEGVPSGVPTAVMWRGVWTPADYSERTVSFQMVLASVGVWPASVAIWDDLGFTLPVAANAQVDFGGGVSVNIVPGPSSLALLGLGGLIAVRRRR